MTIETRYEEIGFFSSNLQIIRLFFISDFDLRSLFEITVNFLWTIISICVENFICEDSIQGNQYFDSTDSP